MRTALLCLLPSVAWALPFDMTVQGRLLDAAGGPISGQQTVRVSLYGTVDAATPVFTQTFPAAQVDFGYFSAVLSVDDGGDDLDTHLFTGELFVGFTVGEDPELTPRHALAHAPGVSIHVDGVVRAATPAADCVPSDAATYGLLRFDAGLNQLRVCTANGWAGIPLFKTVVNVNGVRRWSDGSHAGSCELYRRPTTGTELYSGDTGSGVYAIDAGTGVTPVTCDMETLEGGWTVLADGDYATGDPCPTGWVGNSAGADVNAPTCWRNEGSSSGGRAEATFAAPHPYSEVKVAFTAWQYWSMDAFGTPSGTTADSIWVDGAGLTLGDAPPRQHLYTWSIGNSLSAGTNGCPQHGGEAAPSFIGSNWQCETGNQSSTSAASKWYAPVLFGGTDIAPLPVPGGLTTEPLQMILMSDQQSGGNEDIGARTLLLMVR